jgi:type I restriction enzyme S subunit
VPWLALPDIRKLHGKLAHKTTESINDDGLANSSARLLPVGTVCVSRTASIGFTTTLGRPMATSQDFCNWICGEELQSDYLMLAFMASQAYLQSIGSGAVHKTIYMPTIQAFHIALPSITTQREIARRATEQLDAARDVVERVEAELEMAKALQSRILSFAFNESHE